MHSELHTFMDTVALFSRVADRLAGGAARDAYAAADRLIAACDGAQVVVADDPRWVAGDWWQRDCTEPHMAVGVLLCVRALADRPDLCAAVVRHIAGELERALLSDGTVSPGEA